MPASFDELHHSLSSVLTPFQTSSDLEVKSTVRLMAIATTPAVMLYSLPGLLPLGMVKLQKRLLPSHQYRGCHLSWELNSSRQRLSGQTMLKMLWHWLGWFWAILMDTSHIPKPGNYSMSRPVKFVEKIENVQSYQKPSIILPRVIPTILMRFWDMLGWLDAFLVDN